MISSDGDDIPTEAETWSQRRRRRAVVTRPLVPLAGGASVPFVGSSHERSRDLLEEAFDVGMYHIRCAYSWCPNIAPHFLCFVIFDHFNNDPVATPIHATGHQLVTLCRSVCAEKMSQILEPIMSSK